MKKHESIKNDMADILNTGLFNNHIFTSSELENPSSNFTCSSSVRIYPSFVIICLTLVNCKFSLTVHLNRHTFWDIMISKKEHICTTRIIYKRIQYRRRAKKSSIFVYKEYKPNMRLRNFRDSEQKNLLSSYLILSSGRFSLQHRL